MKDKKGVVLVIYCHPPGYQFCKNDKKNKMIFVWFEKNEEWREQQVMCVSENER